MTDVTKHRLDLALTLAATIGTLCVIAAALCLAFGVRPVIFETGSMAPAVPTGSIGFARTVPAADVRPGDIVTVTRDDGVRVTHRVVTVTPAAGTAAILTLRGDANASPDPQPYIVSTVYRSTTTIPVVGYLASWLSAPHTLVLQALAAAGLLAIAFAPHGGWRRTTTGRRVIAGTAVATSLALGATAVHGVGDAAAAPLTGTATATGTVTAGRPENPTSLRCDNASGGIIGIGSSVTLTFPNPTSHSAYTYRIVTTGSGGPQTSNFAASSLPTPTATVDAGSLGLVSWLISLIPALLGGSVTLTMTLTNYVGNFASSGSLSQQVVVKGGGLTGLVPQLSCKTPGAGGTVTGPAARRAAPNSTQSSTAAVSSASSETSGPSSSAVATPPGSASSSTISESTSSTTTSVEPPTSQTPELPPGGTPSPSGGHAFFRDGATLTIRDATTTAVEYTGDHSPGSTVRWRPGADVLEIIDLDGTVTTMTWTGSRWDEAVTRPQTTEAPTAEPAAPTTRSADTPVPEVGSATDHAVTESG
ncbi:signal peptidase I [Gordonia sp. PDNC005]|uniref:signal peptidase I n=1 Tax=unclassified Gordonia (in: high G+C Gram-positive bacteria) TaxID=2657482 RepID=UPI0019660D06|nr:signal peptidase I [Gordonia sp. PDNC005]QRY61142.1 signal peptidase I [Gordonia sp. PDNC005]